MHYDAADCFAYLLARLESHKPRRVDLQRWREGSGVAVSILEHEIISTGTVSEEVLAKAISAPQNQFLLLMALDRAFARLAPYAGVLHVRMGRYLYRFNREHRYNSDIRLGIVLPRRCNPARPQIVPDSLSENFQHLMLVNKLPDGLSFRRPEAGLDAPHKSATDAHEIGDIKVACVPFIDKIEELDIARVDTYDQVDPNGDWYRISARSQVDIEPLHWQKRIAESLANIDESGAHIGVVPELALTPEILAWWQTALRTTPKPESSPLEWVLVGTGPFSYDGSEQPLNRAILLHRKTGLEVMHQDKCEPFTLSDLQITKWGLDSQLGTGPLAEWMLETTERHVLDTRLARIAILVCEDHARLLTTGKDLVPIEPDLIIVPIFAPPIIRHRWQESCAEHFANTMGSSTVVVTSRAVKLMPKRRVADDPRHRVWASKAAMYARNVDSGEALVVTPSLSAGGSFSPIGKVKRVHRDPAEALTFSIPR
ncbi:hypothetical protein Cs7R123_14260 [Catellatospora sp. TT07R-123]|uniref:hypothetical protein n=1 Tax=Catellatospora sp. TT07R-123 TaxID=2733863 RepID=UPI001B1FF3CD|nr:hypothetical protein [Catellatospora sp. TT07R-123]GHJ44084.1 hypothetical protein Cs7R123_14260 [Catellatospora sp. TT07R-123]